MIFNRIILFIFILMTSAFGAQPTISIYKAASPQYVEDDRNVTYILTVVNTTNNDINVTLYDNMDNDLFPDTNITIIDDSGLNCEINTSNEDAELICNNMIVLSDSSKTIRYSIVAPEDPMQITNYASITDNNNNELLSEANATVTILPDYEGHEGKRDLCYLPPTQSDTCSQSGAFFYGEDCNTSVTILDTSEDEDILADVHVFKSYTSTIETDDCYTDISGTECIIDDLENLLNSESSTYFREAFEQAQDYVLDTLDRDGNSTLVDINTRPVSTKKNPVTNFEYIALIGQYNYVGEDETYEEYIYPCDGNYTGASLTQTTYGGINDVNLTNTDITANNAAIYIPYETYNKVGTKIVNQPFILGVTYIDEDGNPAEYNGEFGDTGKIVNAPVVLQYKGVGEPDENYKTLWAGELPHLAEHILTLEDNLNDGANQNAYPVIEEAIKVCQIKVDLIDYGRFFREIEGLNCGSSNLESGLCLVPACLNSAEQIFSVFPLEDYPHVATCVYGDGGGHSPCDSNAYLGNCGGKTQTISPPKYNNDYGCAQCLADAVSPEIIYNGFSVRPKDFSLKVPEWKNGLNQAGRDYPIDLNATAGTGNPSDISEIDNSTQSTAYNTTLEGYHPPEVLAVIGLESNASLTCPDENNESQTITFVEGYSSSPINYHNVGKVKLVIMDQNWTSHDHNTSKCIIDSNETNPVLDPLGLGRVGCMVKTEKSMIFVPDHFNIDVNLTDHNNISNLTYLHNINRFETDDNHSMGASLIVDIKAMGADNNVTTNYMETCYAKETNLTLVLDSTNVTYPGSTPALTQFLSYNPVEDDGTSNSGERNYNFSDIPNLIIDPDPVLSTITIPNLPINNNVATFPADAPEGNGTSHIEYKLNFDRKHHLVVNPINMDLSDVNITDTDEVETAVINYIDRNATFYYARSRASKFFYEDIDTQDVNTPIMVDVYCDLLFATCRNLGIDTVDGQINEVNWWLSLGHDTGNGDGNITLMESLNAPLEGTSADWSVTPNVNITSGATDPNIVVDRGTTPTLPLTVEIELDETNPTDTNHWLIYNENADDLLLAPPSPFYKVRFIGTSGWAGHGKTGHVVDSNVSIKKNRRMEW